MTIRSCALLAALYGGVLTLSSAEPSEPAESIPETSKPTFIVPAADVLESKTIQQSGREVTLRKIRPIALPEPQSSGASSNLLSLPSVQQRATEIQEENPEKTLLQATATVFRPTDSPPLSFVQLRSRNGETVTFWSSADFAYLTSVPSFSGVDGKSYTLLLICGVSQAHTRAEVLSEAGSQPPPEFARDKASFSIVSTQPVPEETRAAIQALHEIYHHEHERLQGAYDEAQRIRLRQEAEAKADKRPVTLNYWRTQTTTNDTAGKGGAR